MRRLPLTVSARGRPHHERLGKVETSQVGTFVAFVKGDTWMGIDGELFLPEAWFSKRKAAAREKLGVPSERKFATQIAPRLADD